MEKKTKFVKKEAKENFNTRLRPSVRQIADKKCLAKHGVTLGTYTEHLVMKDFKITEADIEKYNSTKK